MSGHAKLSPSSAHRWMACPGSARLTADLPDRDSVYSREGSFAHEIAANLLESGLKATTAVGTTDGEFIFDSVMAAHVQTYLDAVRGTVLLTGGSMLIERQVTFTDNVWGTADALVWNEEGTELHVFDLKYGAGTFVPVEDNEQLMTYAVGALRTFHADSSRVHTIHIHIVQPRSADGDAWRTVTLVRSTLELFAMRLFEAAKRAETSDELVPGDQCKFCRASAICPALREQSLAVAREVFPAGDVMKPRNPPHPSDLSVDRLGDLLNTVGIVDLWVKAVREYAHHLATTGAKIPGWKLVEKIGNRRWTDEDRARAELIGVGISPHEPPKLISPAKAEKAIGKAGPAIVSRLTLRPITGVALVHESDARPPHDPASVFDAQ